MLIERLGYLEDALFDYDASVIRPDAAQALEEDVAVIRRLLAKYPRQMLMIEGHADERGSAEYNLALGDRRARAAAEYLQGFGIASSQIEVISFGKDQPLCSDAAESCWQLNRRARITAPNMVAIDSTR